MSTGSIIGGVLGGIGGAAFGNPAIGYSLGSSIGGTIDGAVKWKRAQQMGISPTDPRQVTLLRDIINRRKALDAGAMYQPQQQAIAQQGAYGMNRAARATGGDPMAAIQALAMINRGTGRSMGELYGQMQQEGLQLMGMQNQLAGAMGARDFQVQAYDKAQAMGHASRMLQNSMGNLAGFMMRQGQGDGQFGDWINRIFGGGQGMGAEGVDGVASIAPVRNTGTYLPQDFLQSITGMDGYIPQQQQGDFSPYPAPFPMSPLSIE